MFAVALKPLGVMRMTGTCAGTPPLEWTYRTSPPPGMTRAELHFKDVTTNSLVAGVLILSPGMNGDGLRLLKDDNWCKFACRRNLLMVGLSFASIYDDLENGRGYYYVDKGSGDVLLKGLSEAKADELPLYMYGFSGGAHFTSRFVLWCPRRVSAWCAYSAAWWKKPPFGKFLPPGIVACGESDFRLEPSRRFFEEGRVVDAKWLWIGLHGVDHVPSPALEEFFRKYVESLEYADVDGAWINVHLGREEELSFVRRGSPAPLVGYPKGHCFQTGRRLGGCNEVEVDDTLSSNMA